MREERPNDALTIEEVMEQLRVKSKVTVYRMVHRGELVEPYRVGGRSLWRRADVERAKWSKQGLRKRRRAR